MNNNIHIPTDEQFAAYVSNTASPEDVAIVETWIKEDPKHLDELLDISVAASLAERQYAKVHFMPWYRRPVYWGAAAVVVIVLVAGVLWYQPVGVPERPMVAETDVPTVVGEKLPTPKQEQTTSARQKVEESLPSLTLQREEHTTATQAVAATFQPLLELSYPRRIREVCMVGQPVTFRWQSNAASITILLFDADGQQLLERDLTGSSDYTIPSSTLQGQEEVRWTLIASFAEGQSIKREGTIALIINE